MIEGVSQGSVLVPALFNIFKRNILIYIEKSDLCVNADEGTNYPADKSLSLLILKILLKDF